MTETHLSSNMNSIMSWASRLPGVFGNVVRKAVQQYSEDAAEQGRKNAQAGRPFLYKRSGALVRGIKPLFKQSGSKLDAGITFPKIPGLTLNDGAVILPRRGKYLTFRLFANTTEATPTGPWRRSRRVVIPKTEWATKAIQDTSKKFPALLQQQVVKAWREAARGTP